jgi:catechol 2,3-dioxygenase-like lactoylglutathione lyase family enzyme
MTASDRPPLALNHLNLPARDPVAQRRWYAETLGFRANGAFLWSAGTLLAFVPGEPIASGAFHFGFRIETMDALREWVHAIRARGAAVSDVEGDESYATARLVDPEGNEIELFHEAVP